MGILIYDYRVVVNGAWDARTYHDTGAPGWMARGREAVDRVVALLLRPAVNRRIPGGELSPLLEGRFYLERHVR